MFYLVYNEHRYATANCDMCHTSTLQRYFVCTQSALFNRLSMAILCKNCHDTKWPYKKYCGYPQYFKKNVLLIPLAYCSYCDICFCVECQKYDVSCVRLIFANASGQNIEVCRTCLSNQLTKVMHKILPELRTREMMETLHEHTTQQNYFSYLNYSEQNIIEQERTTIKKLIDLPNVLCDIVLSYYWIF